jgi:DNA end-binding protein Ku
MPRAMWRGAIQFGLVTIPVRLFTATENRGGLSFNMLHAEDNKRIQMKVHCPDHGEIKRSDTVRGYEWSKGQYVVMEESDFEAVPLKTIRAIEIEQFVPTRRDEGPSFVKQSYYLEPEPMGRKAFQLLKTVLADSQLQAICKIVLRDRELLAALDPFGNTMLLSTLYWPDEVRDVGELDIPDADEDFKPSELDMAHQLVETLTGDFDATRYKDEYREALLGVIDSKLAGQPVVAPAPAAETSKLTDLMAVLEASVAAARADADGASGTAAVAAEEPISVEKARKKRTTKAKAASAKSSAAKPKAAATGKGRGKSTAATQKRKSA